MNSNKFLFLSVCIMFGSLVFLIVRVQSSIRHGAVTSATWTTQDQIEYANILTAKGLNLEAASVLEDYISTSADEREKLAKICYRLGVIYMDILEYRKALQSFYRAELLDSEGDFIHDMNQKIVEALENSGMSAQARYELDARTSLHQKPEQKTGKVIARIDNEEITEQEINRAIDRLPEWAKKHVETEEGRRDFIGDYVAKEVLYRKAKRLGLERTSEAKVAVEELKKQLAVQQLVQKEMEENLRINPEDLRLYYEAHKDIYIEDTGEEGSNEKRQMSFEEVKDRVEQEYILRKRAEITKALLKKAMEEQEVEIYAATEGNQEEEDKE